MTREEKDDLLLWQKRNPEVFAWRLYTSACKGRNLQFVIDAGDALRPSQRESPLHMRVSVAYLELAKKHRGKVTKEMIRKAVDPDSEIPLPRFAEAFKKAHLGWLPRGKPGPRSLRKNA